MGDITEELIPPAGPAQPNPDTWVELGYITRENYEIFKVQTDLSLSGDAVDAILYLWKHGNLDPSKLPNSAKELWALGKALDGPIHR
jgi:hypothetical protein